MRVFTQLFNSQGRAGQPRLYFEGEFEPVLSFDGINSVVITCENSQGKNGKEVSITFSREEAAAIRRALDSQGV